MPVKVYFLTKSFFELTSENINILEQVLLLYKLLIRNLKEMWRQKDLVFYECTEN